MKNLLEELWNGCIKPGEKCGDENGKIKELTELMEKNKDALNQNLNACQKEMFKKYQDCVEEYLYLMTAEAFGDGFCLASRLLTEALV